MVPRGGGGKGMALRPDEDTTLERLLSRIPPLAGAERTTPPDWLSAASKAERMVSVPLSETMAGCGIPGMAGGISDGAPGAMTEGAAGGGGGTGISTAAAAVPARDGGAGGDAITGGGTEPGRLSPGLMAVYRAWARSATRPL